MKVGVFGGFARDVASFRARVLGGMFGSAIVLAGVLAPSAAFASTQTGIITGVNYLGGRVLFTVGGSRADRPTCDCCNRWEILVNDPGGQALLAILLEAYRGGRTVAIGGTGACQAEANDTEGVNSLQTL